MFIHYKLRIFFIVVSSALAGFFAYIFFHEQSPIEIGGFINDDIPRITGIPENVCDIRDYGAIESWHVKSTVAINAAVDDCFSKGGGTVLVPKGRWFSGGITLKSNIHLFLTEGAEISFSTDLKDYLPVVLTRFQGIEFYNYTPLIYVADSHNIAITGMGKLIGNGDAREAWTGGGNFEAARKKLHTMSQQDVPIKERIFGDKEPGLRPSFIQFMHCKDILLDGFTVENGPMWTIHPVYSENFIARNLTINTWSGNTDGIDIDSTRNVVIEDCYFSTGDDAIAIKSGLDTEGRSIARPSENIVIRNILVEKGSSGVSIGSEMSGGVAHVDVRDSVFRNTRHGFRIKSTKSRGGFIEGVVVENITMDHMSGDAIDINLAYSSELQSDLSYKPTIKNIVLNNIHGRGNERLAINVDGIPNPIMEDVRIENITFTSAERGVSFNHAKNVFMKNIVIDAKEDPIFEFKDSQVIGVSQSHCRKNAQPCVLVHGGKSDNIILYNMDFSDVSTPVHIVDGATRSSVVIENSL